VNNKKYKWRIAIVAVISVALVPAINLVFKINAPIAFFGAEWTAGEALGYIGSLLEAAATIYVVKLGIDLGKEAGKEERRLAAKPFLTSNCVSKNEYIGPEENLVYITITADSADRFITCGRDVPYGYPYGPNERVNIMENLALKRDYHIIEYKIENVGAGNAIAVDMKINGETPLRRFAISKDTKRTFVFIVSANMFNEKNEYLLDIDFMYQDIVSIAHYQQHETIRFFMIDDTDTFMHSDSEHLLSDPEEIK
jgi:hypothetical protein